MLDGGDWWLQPDVSAGKVYDFLQKLPVCSLMLVGWFFGDFFLFVCVFLGYFWFCLKMGETYFQWEKPSLKLEWNSRGVCCLQKWLEQSLSFCERVTGHLHLHGLTYFKLWAKVANDCKSSVSFWKMWLHFSWVGLPPFFVFSLVFLVHYGWCNSNIMKKKEDIHPGFFHPFLVLPINLSGPKLCFTDLTFMLMLLFDVLTQTIQTIWLSCQICLGIRF